MQLTNTPTIRGYNAEERIGLVTANSVRAKWFGKDILAGLRNLIGGEVKEYTEMLEEARGKALDRMIEKATARGADAVVNIRFETSQLTGTASEVLVAGTAIRFLKKK